MMKLLVKQQQLHQNEKGISWKFCLVKFHSVLSSSKLSLKKKDALFSLWLHQCQSALLYTLHYRMVCHLCKIFKNTDQNWNSKRLNMKIPPGFGSFRRKSSQFVRKLLENHKSFDPG
ncbi:hypothetical protein Hanom_Chr04g00309221 [Helianthus anomalus]